MSPSRLAFTVERPSEKAGWYPIAAFLHTTYVAQFVVQLDADLPSVASCGVRVTHDGVEVWRSAVGETRSFPPESHRLGREILLRHELDAALAKAVQP
jgi:hypothetical protein